ncbi:glycoside hydrolase family protein [Roseinatronobacter sp. NSM]|uniref:glycoside hydrolase family protein n=1 Tax=Roseinatronobacter sp. NSM TaxID=3457785 RepID=UPI0040372CF6
MQTSAQGVAFKKRHEGDVLKAYRCPAGVWTVGVGLTAASGVVKPHAGMKITAAESTRLLQLALRRNYEPAVRAAMPRAKQHEFDAGVSFHFNTGAIARASWVKRWVERNWDATRTALLAWNKGGGRVLPGLTRRREEEYRLLRHGDYGQGVRAQGGRDGLARVVVDLSQEEIAAAQAAFVKLGYKVGDDARGFDLFAIRAFQKDHDLTVDGIVGRATLSTLQRVMDSRTKAATPAAVTAAGGADTTVQASAELDPALSWIGPALLAAGALWGLWLAWQYRDAIAAAIAPRFPRLARKLWSI